MSARPTSEPACDSGAASSQVAVVIDARERNIGGFHVRRLLPSSARRLVGPFIYFDQMGPVAFGPGEGLDVPPHPHIGLATVTYLFEGALVHRDSLGSQQRIEAGAVNWMTAGRGIAHSERTPAELRGGGARLHGLQLWVALPVAREEMEPSFEHHPADALPTLELGAARIRLLAGAAWGAAAPVAVHSPLFYADVSMPAGAALELPGEHPERAAYVVEGEVGCGAQRAGTGRMLVFGPGAATLQAPAGARLVVLGGAPLDGPRHIWWNYVSSSTERIEQAKRDWKEQRFGRVPDDDALGVPLPER